MNRMLDFVRGRLAGPPDATDRHLLDRFLDQRDESAFAEVVRRHGPLVWGVCRRRLANTHDAEDAFQATFLVLVRRAANIAADVPVGPWLHRVAVMTTRNVARGNRRRAAVSGPMEHDAPTPAVPEVEHDIDAALLALPERERAAVVLCHLQGFTRKEAAARLGCPEGTLSARLSRALGRLRTKLDRVVPAVAVPIGLSAGTVRAAGIRMTSSLTAAGVSPAVAGVTNGVLRMLWVKKLVAASAFVALLGGGLMVGVASDPKPLAPVSAPLAGQPDDPAAEAKRIAEKIVQLKQQQAEAERDFRVKIEALERASAERLRLHEKELAAAKKLPADVVVVVVAGGRVAGQARPPYTIREVIGGTIGEMHCADVAVLETYLTRAFADPKGPKTVAVTAGKDIPQEQVAKVLAACAKAGFKKATFSLAEAKPTEAEAETALRWLGVRMRERQPADGEEVKPGEIDLNRYLHKPADNVIRKW